MEQSTGRFKFGDSPFHLICLFYIIYIVKVELADCSQEWPEGSLFNTASSPTPWCRGGSYSFPWIAPPTLDLLSLRVFGLLSSSFQPICPPAFFRCLSNSGTFTELQTTSSIESTEVAYSDSVSHNQIQVLSIPVLLLACSEDWTCNLRMIVSLKA